MTDANTLARLRELEKLRNAYALCSDWPERAMGLRPEQINDTFMALLTCRNALPGLMAVAEAAAAMLTEDKQAVYGSREKIGRLAQALSQLGAAND